MLHNDPEDLSHVFPGLIRDRDLDRMLEAMHAMTPADFQRRCTNTARVATARTTGWQWWRCLNLSLKALDNWTIVNGSLLLEGCDSEQMEFGSWLAAAYVVMVRHLERDERMKFEFEVNKIPAKARISPAVVSSKRSLMDFAAD